MFNHIPNILFNYLQNNSKLYIVEDIRFRAINYKGKREYLYDPKGKYVRHNGKFILKEKVKSADTKIRNEINKYFKKMPKLKAKVKGIKDLNKKLYYVKAWYLTESNDLTVLRNHDKRGFRKYHLDHIFPLSVAYKEGIPPEAVSNIKNLRFIHFRQNLKKRDLVTETARDIIKSLI